LAKEDNTCVSPKFKKEVAMGEYKYKQIDFDNPSALFVFEDVLKGLIGGPLLYNPYFKTFGLKGDEQVLDFGCGGGAGSQCLRKILKNNGHLTCVDISNYWIKRAQKRLGKYPDVSCLAGDIRKLDLTDKSFDVITIFHVIHDIAPEDRQDTVNTLARLLSKNGKVFIREPIKQSHGMPVSEIRELFSNAGLREAEFTENKAEYWGVFQPS
jgi:ubiquinone/menaquinone biosynthesis C-methylase UbiE